MSAAAVAMAKALHAYGIQEQVLEGINLPKYAE